MLVQYHLDNSFMPNSCDIYFISVKVFIILYMRIESYGYNFKLYYYECKWGFGVPLWDLALGHIPDLHIMEQHESVQYTHAICIYIVHEFCTGIGSYNGFNE